MTEVRIDSESRLQGEVFRVADFTGGCCRRALWCRIYSKNDGFRLCFYESMRGAEHDWQPIDSLGAEQWELAAKAIAHAQSWAK